MNRSIVLVGYRKAAIEAAHRMGLDVLLLEPAVERTRARPVRRRATVDFRIPSAALAHAVEELCHGTHVSAVVAISEASVPVAAAVRAILGLGGLTADGAMACHDKLIMKDRARAAGIPCADALLIDKQTRAEDIVQRLGLPVVVKQRAASGGRGTVVARDLQTLARALRPGWLAENYIEGPEMSVESLIRNGRPVFVNLTGYLVPGTANVLPAHLPAHTRDQVLALNERVVTTLGPPRGITHLEIFLAKDGPKFGEVAARPPGGYLMPLIERIYGFDPWEALLQVALDEDPILNTTAREAAGVWVLHPGPMRVRAVSGLDDVRKAPGVTHASCRLKAGDMVSRRVGTGESVGRIEVSGRNANEVQKRLLHARKLLHIEGDATA